MLQVSSQLIGQVVLFAFQVWSGDQSGDPFKQSMYWSGDHFTNNFAVKCMVSFLVSVLTNEDLLKSVLECSELMISAWKKDHPSDTKDDTVVWLSSEDEAEDLAATLRVSR